MNFIDKIRKEIEKGFSEHTFEKGESATFLSPSQKFRLNTTGFWLKNTNWDLTKAEIYNRQSGDKILEFFVNDGHFFHGWVTKDNIEYLICAEDIFGGQSVIDLTKSKIQGYSPGNDGFIWTDFHLSPGGKILATIGCYWGGGYEIRLYDFTEPMALPLTELKKISLLSERETITCWLDDETIELSFQETKTIREDLEDGSHILKEVTLPVGEKREAKINEA